MKKPRHRYHHGSVREAALEAAAKDIDAHGHRGFTLERVAKALRVTPAALYRHFANREDLLREVTWVTFEKFVVRVDAVALAPNPPKRMLIAVGLEIVKFALENPGWFRLQFSLAGQAVSDRQKEAHPQYSDALLHALTQITGAEGEALNIHYLTLWATMHGIASLAIERIIPIFQTDEQWLQVAEAIFTNVVEGLSRPRA